MPQGRNDRRKVQNYPAQIVIMKANDHAIHCSADIQFRNEPRRARPGIKTGLQRIFRPACAAAAMYLHKDFPRRRNIHLYITEDRSIRSTEWSDFYPFFGRPVIRIDVGGRGVLPNCAIDCFGVPPIAI